MPAQGHDAASPPTITVAVTRLGSISSVNIAQSRYCACLRTRDVLASLCANSPSLLVFSMSVEFVARGESSSTCVRKKASRVWLAYKRPFLEMDTIDVLSQVVFGLADNRTTGARIPDTFVVTLDMFPQQPRSGIGLSAIRLSTLERLVEASASYSWSGHGHAAPVAVLESRRKSRDKESRREHDSRTIVAGYMVMIDLHRWPCTHSTANQASRDALAY